ncbi:30S ribosomal protein S4 [Methanobrevibacter cuticularis]|uniref:Small ribosomal subunit protein uS4 n=1 Tax=Methanobrevibacter cuticularis TaxID=47311 RepID=A0A166CZK4_9EURY|nr:30S ribosomal protein S4 [Methanobrevibacter cuticularis]KZX17747.1 30S ribosomal protein S4 [Methanobrevibacter cuticularis]
MGHPRKSRKKYDTPPHPWNAERIKAENKLMVKYGLKNKKEIWKADTLVKKYSREARYLLGFSSEQVEEEKNELIGHLTRQGILEENSQLEDILNLTVEHVLRRRLQTMVHQKGLSRTAKEARMFVIHGHIAMNGKKVDSPSYAVKRGEESFIGFYTPSVAKQIEEFNSAKSEASVDDKSSKPSSKKATKKRTHKNR